MKKEYVIWGKKPNEKDESLLLTKIEGALITDKTDAKKAKKLLETKYGCTDVRIQTIDLNEPYTIKDIEKCVEHWGICKVERPYIKRFLDSPNKS